MTRTSTAMAVVPPTRMNSRSSSTRRSLTCVDGGISPISSRKSVPPSASSNRPSRRSAAPVKAPFSWPNNSLSSSVSGSAPTFTAMNGLLRRGLRSAHRARDELLARAALALDEHRARHRRHLLDLAPSPRAAARSRRSAPWLPGARARSSMRRRSPSDVVDDRSAWERGRRSRARGAARAASGSSPSVSPTTAAPSQSCSLHDARRRRVVQLAGEDDEVRLLALDRGADVVERADERGRRRRRCSRRALSRTAGSTSCSVRRTFIARSPRAAAP